jgi:hypothetical protein
MGSLLWNVLAYFYINERRRMKMSENLGGPFDNEEINEEDMDQLQPPFCEPFDETDVSINPFDDIVNGLMNDNAPEEMDDIDDGDL